jgi:hypothetical protein
MAQRVAASEKRDRDADYQREKRASEKLVILPRCVDPIRRRDLEQDDEAWLLHYFGMACELEDPFWYRFTSDQRGMIEAIGHAIKYGGDQSIAASRGDGKSTIAQRLVLKHALAGKSRCTVLLASTGEMAEDALEEIKSAIEFNPLLAEDYPEVCIPVQALEGAPQRANSQIISGDRPDTLEPFEMAETRFRWCGQQIIFPKIPGAIAAGSVIATRGLESAVRGLKKLGKRPNLVIVDDPDTEDTSRSEEQAAKLERRIDAALGFLGGQRQSIGRVILTTIQSRIAVSYRFTDPVQKPSFKGRRNRFLITKPERMDLWEDYIALRIAGHKAVDADGKHTDEFCRRAHQFYLDNREEMDRGAVVSNINRFVPAILPDGSQQEVSALQHYYNHVADKGQTYVSTELDNDPPDDSSIVESGITAERVQRQVSGFPRGIIPPGCVLLTQGIDVGKWRLHWVVVAWMPDGTGFVIDYGTHATHGAVKGQDEGLDVLVRRAILERMDDTKLASYCLEDGEVLPVDLTLVDARYRTDAVYSAVATIGVGVMPVMGFGKSSGCVSADFSAQQRATVDKRPGDNWFQSRKGKLWLVCANADHWKAWEHDRWMTDPARPGSLRLWGSPSEDEQRLSQDQKDHLEYSRHIVAETECEKPHKGGMRREWVLKNKENHWFDASIYAAVAMSIRGLRIEASAPSNASRRASDATKRPSLSQMSKGKR